DEIFQAGTDDELEYMGPGKGAFSRKVNGICHLRVAHAGSGDSSDLGAEMDPAGVRDVDHASDGCHLARKIPIFVPAVERKGFVEAKGMFPNRSQPQAHIASIRQIDGSDLL